MRIIRGKRFDSVSNTKSTWAARGGVVVVVAMRQWLPLPGGIGSEERKRGGYIVLVNVSPRTDLTWLAIIK